VQHFPADSLKYVYSPEHEPVGTVDPGERFVVDTEDGFTGLFRDPANWNEETAAWAEDNLNPVTGPISVRGTKAGGAVAVRLHDVAVTTPGSLAVSRCEARSPFDWWHEEDHAISLPVSDGRIHVREDWSLPARPLIGCLATAPRHETVLSRHEGRHGGNMDCTEMTTGATVILPAEVDGAYLYFGDCKAGMGDGEITAAPEVGTRIVASADTLERPPQMHWPRIVTETTLVTVVSDISLAQACRFAFAELMHWVEHDYGLSREEAAVVLGIASKCGICQVSNLLHTAKCSIEIGALPPTR
jgi:amidase